MGVERVLKHNDGESGNEGKGDRGGHDLRCSSQKLESTGSGDGKEKKEEQRGGGRRTR